MNPKQKQKKLHSLIRVKRTLGGFISLFLGIDLLQPHVPLCIYVYNKQIDSCTLKACIVSTDPNMIDFGSIFLTCVTLYHLYIVKQNCRIKRARFLIFIFG